MEGLCYLLPVAGVEAYGSREGVAAGFSPSMLFVAALCKKRRK
jgi:hypothetical protein